MRPLSRQRQRGAATLFVVVLLCFAIVLAVGFAHRNALVEERRSAADYRAAQAFEAAEAGLEWSLARGNEPTPLGADCRPSADPAAMSLRERMLRFTDPAGAVAAATWDDAGTATPLQAACVRGASGWSCSCPTHGRPVLPVGEAAASGPAFVVEFHATARPGVVGVVATGCTRRSAAGLCAPATDVGHGATARLEAAWALLPALRAAPAAALTVGGDVAVGATALGARNVDPSTGGLAVHAGGRIAADALRLGAPPGAALAGSLTSADHELAGLGRERLFARYFGMAPRDWSTQPAVQRIACPGDCSAQVAAAVGRGHRLVWIDGDGALAGPLALGSAGAPVVIAASGTLRVDGAVAIHGVVHAAALEWNGAAPGAFVAGATVVAGDYRGNAAVDFVRDGAALAALQTRAGSFVRVNGSWKDFR